MLWELSSGQSALHHIANIAPDLATMVVAGGLPQAVGSLLTLPPGALPAYRALCERCLAADPALRPPFEAIVATLCDVLLESFPEEFVAYGTPQEGPQ